jgi:hypothetical protein
MKKYSRSSSARWILAVTMLCLVTTGAFMTRPAHGMLDILFIGLMVVFFLLCWAFVRLCEKV